jgi:hypothetical protein
MRCVQGDEDQAVIPGDDELLGMEVQDLRTLAKTHGVKRKKIG